MEPKLHLFFAFRGGLHGREKLKYDDGVDAAVAQWVEQVTCNHQGNGSSPFGGSIWSYISIGKSALLITVDVLVRVQVGIQNFVDSNIDEVVDEPT